MRTQAGATRARDPAHTMRGMFRSGSGSRGRAAIAALLAVVIGGALVLLHPPAGASAATTCSVKKDGRKLGTTYVTKLTVTSVTCTTAKSVVKAFHRCRRSNGGVSGHCTRAVEGFRCTETRDTIPTQFVARATCRSGGRAIRFTYTQFT
jgi:hypothetical protein